MEKTEKKENKYGLLGKDISYSFSRGYFMEKFKDLGLTDHVYENYDIPEIEAFETVLAKNDLKGLNVTIPYKEQVIPYLTELDPVAEQIGAVNTIQFKKNKTKGFNTDAYGFRKSLEPFLQSHHTKALILGTGGASKAIRYVLQDLGIAHTYISRKKTDDQLTYQELSKEIIDSHTIIINCTPVGTHPNVADKPEIPYHYLSEKHLLFDLIYNPEKTAFLAAGEANGATICNGLKMLQLQAEKAWEIWNGS